MKLVADPNHAATDKVRIPTGDGKVLGVKSGPRTMSIRHPRVVEANAAPRCGARSKRTGKPCRVAAMPNGRCKVHGGKSTRG